MNKHFYQFVCIAGGMLLISSCSHKSAGSPYASLHHRPAPDLIQYFTGHIKGSGVKYNAEGKVVARFRATVSGEMHDGDLFIRETMKFTDGQEIHREACLHLDSNRRIVAAASDATTLIEGERIGNAMRFTYKAKATPQGKRLHQTYDQLVPEFGQFCRAQQIKWMRNATNTTGESVTLDDWFYRINRRISHSTSTLFRGNYIAGRLAVTFKK